MHACKVLPGLYTDTTEKLKSADKYARYRKTTPAFPPFDKETAKIKLKGF